MNIVDTKSEFNDPTKGKVYIFIKVFIVRILLSCLEPDCPSTKGSSPFIYTKSILMIVLDYFYFCYISVLLIGPSRNRSLRFPFFPSLFRSIPSLSGLTKSFRRLLRQYMIFRYILRYSHQIIPCPS